MRLLFIQIIFAVLTTLSVPAYAQSIEYITTLERLEKVNSYRPEQSSKHEHSKDILSSRVLDSTNRVVGEVRDVILDRNGAIEMLNIDFNRLRLRTGPLFVGYHDLSLRPVTNGYKMGVRDDQVKDMVPALLAGMETASGEESEGYSLKNLKGLVVKAADGRTLGKVRDVLFDEQGRRAELIFVSMDYKAARGQSLAIPFSANRNKSGTIKVNDTFADAMIAYASNK